MNLEKIISLPKTLYYNLKIFGWGGGVRLPIFFSYKSKIRGIRKGCIHIENIPLARIDIGFGGTIGIEPNKNTFLIFGENATLIFGGDAKIAAGSTLRIDAGILKLGDGFSCNRNCFISCTKGITFGKQCLLGWNVNVRDADGHTLLKNGEQCPTDRMVFIGDHVWLASYVDILKGVSIPSNCVIGYRSCVTKSVDKENSLIAGYPAHIITNNVNWIK